MVQKCCYCLKVYGEKEPLHDTSITHGICPECLPEVLRSIGEYQGNEKKPIDGKEAMKK